MTPARFLRLVLILDAILLTMVGLGAVVLASMSVLVGVLVGGGIGALNLALLAWLSVGIMSAKARRWVYGLALGVKFAVLVFMVFAAVRWVPMDVIGFVGGLTTAVLAILGGTLWIALKNLELKL